MAKVTYIKSEKNGRHIWIDPWFVEVLCKYLHETMVNNGLSNYNAEILIQHKDFQTTAEGKWGMGIDGAGIYFEESITEDPANLATMKNIMEQTKTYLGSFGSEITIAQLNQHEAQKFYQDQAITWTKPIKVSSLQNVLDIILQMLDTSKEFELHNENISFVGWEGVVIGSRYV